MDAEAPAVIAGEGDVSVEWDVEGVSEAVVFADVVTFDDDAISVAGGAVDLLIANRELLVGVAFEGDASEEIYGEADLKVREGA